MSRKEALREFTKAMRDETGDYLASQVDQRIQGKPLLYIPTEHGAVKIGEYTIEKGLTGRGIAYIKMPMLVEKSRGGNLGFARVVRPSLAKIKKAIESLGRPYKYVVFDDTTSEATTVMTIYECLRYVGAKDKDIILCGLADASGVLDFSMFPFNPEHVTRGAYLKKLISQGKILPASKYPTYREREDNEPMLEFEELLLELSGTDE